MRNLKEAVKDPHTKSLVETIQHILAPKGYQKHSRLGLVAIREGLSEKEVMDISYKLCLEVAKNKIYTAKHLISKVKEVEKELKTWERRYCVFVNAYPTTFYRLLHSSWSRNLMKKYRDMMEEKSILSERFHTLQSIKMLVLSVGPEIPSNVLQQMYKSPIPASN